MNILVKGVLGVGGVALGILAILLLNWGYYAWVYG